MIITINQRNKIDRSLNKVGPIEILLIPQRINRCIVNARSNEAKQRLVFAAMQTTKEAMARMHIRGYVYPIEDKKHNYKEQSAWYYIWEDIKRKFNV